MVRMFFDVNRTGSRIERIPRGFYNYITIYNNTRYDFTMFKGFSTSISDLIGACPAYTLITIPHDDLSDTVNFVWEGDTSPTNERCKIFFTEYNLGLVGEFRPPQISPLPPPVSASSDRRLFGGVVATGNIIIAATRFTIRSLYLANNTATAASITLSHRQNLIDTVLLPTISIPANSVLSLGFIALESGESLFVNNFTGIINLSIYGEGI